MEDAFKIRIGVNDDVDDLKRKFAEVTRDDFGIGANRMVIYNHTGKEKQKPGTKIKQLPETTDDEPLIVKVFELKETSKKTFNWGLLTYVQNIVSYVQNSVLGFSEYVCHSPKDGSFMDSPRQKSTPKQSHFSSSQSSSQFNKQPVSNSSMIRRRVIKR